MNANHTKQTIKIIALTQSTSISARLNHCHVIFLFFAICGISLALLSLPVKASTAPQTITIDVNNPAGIDYSEVDRFTHDADQHAVKYAVRDGSQLIFSDNIIKITEPAKVYHPSYLADLGMMINADTNTATGSIKKMPAYEVVVSNNQMMPSIQEIMEMQLVSDVIAESSHVAPGISDTLQNMKTQLLTQKPGSSIGSNVMIMTASLLLACIGLLMLLITRRSNNSIKPCLYSGKTSDNGMVGEGKMFYFNHSVVNVKVVTINTTFLNVMWHVGKFSKEGSMNTFFYMTFYIPPQREYSKPLKKYLKIKEEESHSHSDG